MLKKRVVKNFSYVFLANVISILVSVTITFLIPIIFAEEVYAYYQLHSLYCGYIWILALGWHEGIYIKYGGEKKETINMDELASQFWLLGAYMMCACGIAVLIGCICFGDIHRQNVFIFSLYGVLIEVVRYVFLYYLICVGSMKQYAKYSIADRIVYVLLVVVLVVGDWKSYGALIGVDLLSKCILLLWIILENPSFFIRKLQPIRIALKDTKELITSGINVTFGYFVSRFVNGTVRLAVDACWGLLVFGKVSFTLTISNLFTQFIQAISVVLFPELRRMSGSNQKKVYLSLSELLDVFMFFAFVLYLPGRAIISVILPQYEESLRYLPILFPLCLFDARNSILNNTYLKALHREKGILISNIIAVVGSVICTFTSVYVFRNLEMAVLTILVAVAIRSYSAECILKREMNIASFKNVFWEVLMSVVFIMANWYVGGMIGFWIYVVALIIYCLMDARNIKSAVWGLLRR